MSEDVGLLLSPNPLPCFCSAPGLPQRCKWYRRKQQPGAA